MYQIQTTSDVTQEQSFSLYDMNVRITLYYNAVLKGFQFDLYNLDTNEYITKMKGLSACSPSLIEFNLPFILVLDDKSGLGVSPVSADDFANRFNLLIMTKDEYREAIRASYSA